MRRASVVLVIVLAAAACGSGDDPSSDASTAAPSTSVPGDPPAAGPESSTPETTAPASDEGSEPSRPGRDLGEAPGQAPPATLAEPPPSRLLDLAVADLADRLGIDAGEIGVVSLDEVTWRNGAIGCPQPGMAYTDALVNGVRIRLLAGEGVYHYHSRGTGEPFYCADPEDPLPTGSGGFDDT
jgi:hypothetical protein